MKKHALLAQMALGAGVSGMGLRSLLKSSPKIRARVAKLLENSSVGKKILEETTLGQSAHKLRGLLAMEKTKQVAPWLLAGSSIPLAMYLKSKPTNYIAKGKDGELTVQRIDGSL